MLDVCMNCKLGLSLTYASVKISSVAYQEMCIWWYGIRLAMIYLKLQYHVEILNFYNAKKQNIISREKYKQYLYMLNDIWG